MIAHIFLIQNYILFFYCTVAEPTGMEVGVDYCQMHETFKIDRTQMTIM